MCFVEKDYQAPAQMERVLEELPGLPAHLHAHVHLLLGGDARLLGVHLLRGVHLDRDVLGVQASLDLLVH